MRQLEEAILNYGRVFPGNVLKVDSFLNHQVDVLLSDKMAEELYHVFKDDSPTKILTLEASGIALAVLVARRFGVPMLFAKKMRTANASPEAYMEDVRSFTRGKTFTIYVSKEYLSPADRVLIVDDFLATGSAAVGMRNIVNRAGATLCGMGIAIEKGFQNGGDELRAAGVKVHSLAVIDSMTDGFLTFRD